MLRSMLGMRAGQACWAYVLGGCAQAAATLPSKKTGLVKSVVNNECEATRRQLVHENLVADTGDNRQEELGLTVYLDDRIHAHPTLA